MTAQEEEAGTDSESHTLHLTQKATEIKLPQSHKHRGTLARPWIHSSGGCFPIAKGKI